MAPLIRRSEFRICACRLSRSVITVCPDSNSDLNSSSRFSICSLIATPSDFEPGFEIPCWRSRVRSRVAYLPRLLQALSHSPDLVFEFFEFFTLTSDKRHQCGGRKADSRGHHLDSFVRVRLPRLTD